VKGVQLSAANQYNGIINVSMAAAINGVVKIS